MRVNTCGKEGREKKKKAKTREEVEGRGNGEKAGESGQSLLVRQVASLMMRCKQLICVEERESKAEWASCKRGGPYRQKGRTETESTASTHSQGRRHKTNLRCITEMHRLKHGGGQGTGHIDNCNRPSRLQRWPFLTNQEGSSTWWVRNSEPCASLTVWMQLGGDTEGQIQLLNNGEKKRNLSFMFQLASWQSTQGGPLFQTEVDRVSSTGVPWLEGNPDQCRSLWTTLWVTRI